MGDRLCAHDAFARAVGPSSDTDNAVTDRGVCLSRDRSGPAPSARSLARAVGGQGRADRKCLRVRRARGSRRRDRQQSRRPTAGRNACADRGAARSGRGRRQHAGDGRRRDPARYRRGQGNRARSAGSAHWAPLPVWSGRCRAGRSRRRHLDTDLRTRSHDGATGGRDGQGPHR